MGSGKELTAFRYLIKLIQGHAFSLQRLPSYSGRSLMPIYQFDFQGCGRFHNECRNNPFAELRQGGNDNDHFHQNDGMLECGSGATGVVW